MRDLTVSADDIGLSKGNTDTIFETVDSGAVTSVSVLTNGFAFQYAIDGWKARHEKLRLAVHLNLTEGKPLARAEDVPHLVDSAGSFKYSPA